MNETGPFFWAPGSPKKGTLRPPKQAQSALASASDHDTVDDGL